MYRLLGALIDLRYQPFVGQKADHVYNCEALKNKQKGAKAAFRL